MKKILLSRTDAIGDMVLTLPMVDVIKQQWPHCQVYIMGRAYTESIVNASPLTDGFVNWSELELQDDRQIVSFFKERNFDAIVHVFSNKRIARLAKRAKIEVRVGTSHRLYHWWTCNRNMKLSRRNSLLHESQLNIKLLEGVGLTKDVDLLEMRNFGQISPNTPLPENLDALLLSDRNKVILHPKSKGSAREWKTENFEMLAAMLKQQNMDVFITGTAKEGELIIRNLGHKITHAHDVTGQMTLPQLITFISKCNVLVAASTGPLHIAASLGIHAVGIYPPIRPMDPRRWAPMGKKTSVLVAQKECSLCRKTNHCACMQEITPQMVFDAIVSNLVK